jgi:hypothetical protein
MSDSTQPTQKSPAELQMDLHERVRALEESVGQLQAATRRFLELEADARIASATRLADKAVSRIVLIEDAIEQDRRRLFDDTARRLHEFQVQISTEWAVLRTVHQETFAAARHAAADSIAHAETAIARTDPTDAHSAAGSKRAGIAVAHRQGFWIAALAAALAAVIIDAAYLHRRLNSARRDVTSRIAMLERPTPNADIVARLRSSENIAEAARATAITAAAQTARMLEVVTASDTRRLALQGQEHAAAAAGQALLSRSRGLLISATGLPPAGAGQVYQVWLQTSRGPLSLGFLAADSRGRANTVFELPPELAGVISGITVTREPAGGAPQPGGIVMLASS